MSSARVRAPPSCSRLPTSAATPCSRNTGPGARRKAAVQKDLTTLRERLTVKQNSDHARQAAELAVESRRTAQKGREASARLPARSPRSAASSTRSPSRPTCSPSTPPSRRPGPAIRAGDSPSCRSRRRPQLAEVSRLPLAKEHEHVEIPGRSTIFRQRDRRFPSELGPVIDDVSQHVPEDVLERNALGVLVVQLRAQVFVGERREIAAHRALFLCPTSP